MAFEHLASCPCKWERRELFSLYKSIAHRMSRSSLAVTRYATPLLAFVLGSSQLPFAFPTRLPFPSVIAVREVA